MKIVITGITGLLGKELAVSLIQNGHEVIGVTRNITKAKKEINLPITWHSWNYETEDFPSSGLENIGGIIHLMGENIGEKRWNKIQKQKIYDSRIISSQKLVQAIQRATVKPQFVISSSAIGIYKSSTTESFTEESTYGDDYLANVCINWEKCFDEIKNITRAVQIRTGVILSMEGSLLKKLLPLYRMSLAGPISTGKQWMSSIHISDAVKAINYIINNESITGPVNLVSPSPCTNNEFNQKFSKYTGRPNLVPVPGLALKVVMGEGAVLALSSQKVLPKKLLDHGFVFDYPNIDLALKNLCRYKKLSQEDKEEFHYGLTKYHYFPNDIDTVFSFFGNAHNLEKITPPFLKFKILEQSTPEISEGTKFRYGLSLHGIPFKWSSRILEFKKNKQFIDDQVKGPYKTWFHEHKFIQVRGGVLMIDDVNYSLPMGIMSDPVALTKIKNDVESIFTYRSSVINDLIKK